MGILLTKTSQAWPSLPVQVCTDKVVIVNLSSDASATNDSKDDNSWRKTRAPQKKLYKVKKNVQGEVLDIETTTSYDSDTYQLERNRYVHTNASDFHRLVVTAQQHNGDFYPFVLMQYRFDKEHRVENKPHGNSKKDIKFIQTK